MECSGVALGVSISCSSSAVACGVGKNGAASKAIRLYGFTLLYTLRLYVRPFTDKSLTHRQLALSTHTLSTSRMTRPTLHTISSLWA